MTDQESPNSKKPKGKGVILTLEMSPDDYERLLEAWKAGKLDALGITEIGEPIVTPPEGEPGKAVTEWAKAEAERKKPRKDSTPPLP